MSGKQAERTSSEKAEGLRERVLRASQALIEQQGLSALSMREVARRAGVSHQAPYNHFADREGILAALAEEGFHIIEARFRAVLDDGALRARGGAALFVEMGRAYVEFACEHPAHFRVMFRPELVDLSRCVGARQAGDSAFACLGEAVEHVAREGFLSGTSGEIVSMLFWSVAHGLSCLALDGPLAHKLPNVERRAVIDGVVTSFGQLIEAQIAGARARSPGPSAPP